MKTRIRFLFVFVIFIGLALASCDKTSEEVSKTTRQQSTISSSNTSNVTNNTPKYTIIWKDGSGHTLETDKNVVEGTIPTYDGATPTKSPNKQYTYEFKGWSPNVTEATKNTTYTAVFTETLVKYKITWKNEDGTILSKTDV